MGQISRINFKKSFAINAEHNDRTLPPRYPLLALVAACHLRHQSLD